MDKETKIFFEKLSGINKGDKNEEEFAPEVSVLDDEDMPEMSVSDEVEGQLTVDVYETPTAFVIKSAVAGVSPEHLDISMTNESLIIKGERHEEEKIKQDKYLHQECYWGRFSRSIIFPQEIDPDKAAASLKNGILKISLPKVNKAKTKKIKVKFE